MKMNSLCMATLPAAVLLAGGAVHAGSIGDALGIGSMTPIGKTNVVTGASSALAGNPAGLVGANVDTVFSGALTASLEGKEAAKVEGKDAGKNPWLNGQVGIGGVYSEYRTDGVTTKRTSIPISYTVRSDLDPRRQLNLRLPITTTSNPFGDRTHIGLGVDYRFPITDEWSLVPAAMYTRVESDEYGKGKSGDLYNAGLTSVYTFDLDSSSISIGNMLGYLHAPDLDPTMTGGGTAQQNWVTRNAVLFSMPVTLGGKRLTFDSSLINTHYWGDEIYNKEYNEIGFGLGTNRSGMSSRSYLRGNVSYLFSNKTEGFSVNLGYWF